MTNEIIYTQLIKKINNVSVLVLIMKLYHGRITHLLWFIYIENVHFKHLYIHNN